MVEPKTKEWLKANEWTVIDLLESDPAKAKELIVGEYMPDGISFDGEQYEDFLYYVFLDRVHSLKKPDDPDMIRLACREQAAHEPWLKRWERWNSR